MGFDFMFSVFPIIFFLIFFIVIGFFIVVAVKGVGEWNKNNHSPRLAVGATCVAKRTQVSHSTNQQTGMSSSSTSYYATFEVDSGDRMEFHLSSAEYGQLAEGDMGTLHFQGTRYLGFDRGYGSNDW